MPDPFTIRIFLPSGDPEGVRLIDRMNWTGSGLFFPRKEWEKVRTRPEMKRMGVYILSGYSADDDLPTLYIGQADGVGNRISTHDQRKPFWDHCIVFTSSNEGLNRAHVTWLEYALIKQAREIDRSQLENGNTPQEPALSEAEKADMQGFLKEILQILPLVGWRAFEPPQAVEVKFHIDDSQSQPKASNEPDTIVVPAHEDGFQKVFLGEKSWYAIRISGGMLSKIKYVAAYRTAPISAVTHYAPVDRIEPYGDKGKYKLVFASNAVALEPIQFEDAGRGFMQNSRYTTLEKLKTAKKVSDLQWSK